MSELSSMYLKSMVFILILVAPILGYGAACDKFKISNLDEKRAQYSLAISAQLKKDLPNVSDVEILKMFKSGTWFLIYVSTKVSDEVVLFYNGDPVKGDPVAQWSGAAMVGENKVLEKWASDNARGIPKNLAKCFSWFVIEGR